MSGKVQQPCPECHHGISVHGKWKDNPACWHIRTEGEEDMCNCTYDMKGLFKETASV